MRGGRPWIDVTEGGEHASDPRGDEVARRGREGQRQQEADVIRGRVARQAERRLDARDVHARAAAGETLGCGQQAIDGHREAERRDREVRSLQTRGGKAQREAGRGRRYSRRGQRRQDGHAREAEVCERERTDREEPRLAERCEAGVADEQVLAEDTDRRDRDERRAYGPRAGSDERQRQQQREQGGSAHPRPEPPAVVTRGRSHRCRPRRALVRRPCPRSTRDEGRRRKR